LSKLSNTITASNKNKYRGSKQKDKEHHDRLIETVSRGGLGGFDNVVDEQGAEADEGDDLEDQTG
jgi:hypothetical protein